MSFLDDHFPSEITSKRATRWGLSNNQVVSNPHLQAMNGRLEGEQPYLGDLLTMIINHLLTGMILRVAANRTERSGAIGVSKTLHNRERFGAISPRF